jgi:chitodextrinase
MIELLLALTLGAQRPKDATIVLSPASVTLSAGGVQQFTANTTGATRLPVWTATGGAITQTGRYTAGSVAGVYTVTATLQANVRASATVTIAVPSAGDTTAPTVPTNLAASVVTQTSFDVTWSASQDAVGVASYGIYLIDSVLTDAVVGTVANFSGLMCGKPYTVTVDAVDAAGNRSAKAATLTVWTVACDIPVDNVAPTVPTNLSATTTQTSVILGWNASTDLTGVSGYGVYVNGALRQAVTDTSATVAGLVCGTSYIAGVDAVDAAGNRSAALSVTITTLACAGASVTWTAIFTPSPEHDALVVSYGIELRASTTSVTTTPVAVANLGKPAVVDGEIHADVSALVNPLPTGSYYANVRAIGAMSVSELSLASPVFSLGDSVLDTEPPSKPQDLTASAVTATSLSLWWTASFDNVGVVKYLITRNGNYYATRTGTTLSAINLTCGQAYLFSVQAFDLAGNASPVNSIFVTMGPCAPLDDARAFMR